MCGLTVAYTVSTPHGVQQEPSSGKVFRKRGRVNSSSSSSSSSSFVFFTWLLISLSLSLSPSLFISPSFSSLLICQTTLRFFSASVLTTPHPPPSLFCLSLLYSSLFFFFCLFLVPLFFCPPLWVPPPISFCFSPFISPSLSLPLFPPLS